MFGLGNKICNIFRRYGRLYCDIYTCGPRIRSWLLKKILTLSLCRWVFSDVSSLFTLLIKHNPYKSSHILDKFLLPVQLAPTLKKFICHEDGGSNLQESSEQSCHPRAHDTIILSKPAG